MSQGDIRLRHLVFARPVSMHPALCFFFFLATTVPVLAQAPTRSSALPQGDFSTASTALPNSSNVQPPINIAVTAEFFGYLRNPDRQVASNHTCPSDFVNASANTMRYRQSLPDATHTSSDTVLIAMGNNFAPNLYARIFSTAPNSSNPYLLGKDLYDWDFRHLNTAGQLQPDWVYADSKNNTDLSRNERAAGQGFIPMDNVGCFLIAAGYDAIVPGKHDFYFGPERLRQLARLLASTTYRNYDGKTAGPVQMLAGNLVIRTTYAATTKMLTDDERHVKYAITDPDKNEDIKPADFSDGKHILPWLPSLQFSSKQPGDMSVRLCRAKPDDPATLFNATGRAPRNLDEFKQAIASCPQWILTNPASKKDPESGETTYMFTLSLSGTPPLELFQNYLICPGQGVSSNPKTPFCLRFTVDGPFLQYPNALAKDKVSNAGNYADPQVYVWKCLADANGQLADQSQVLNGRCPDGHREVAIFGVVDPQLKEHVGELNFAWWNGEHDGKKYSTEIAVLDPADVLSGLLKKLKADHPQFHGVKILLAQMSPAKAEQLASKLNGKFNVIVSEPQVERITQNGTFSLDSPRQLSSGDEVSPSLLVVPPQYFDAEHNTPVLWPRTLKVQQDNSVRWTFTLQGDREELSKGEPARVLEQTWFKSRVDTAVAQLRLDKYPDPNNVYAHKFKDKFRDYVLHVMLKTADADLALLQKRDLYLDAAFPNQDSLCAQHPTTTSCKDENYYLALGLERILWKGDFLVKRMVVGKVLKDILKRSKGFEADDASILSLETEKNRALLSSGIVYDPERDEYVVNGEPLDEGRLYSVATSDYAALGDTGYPELLSVSVAGPKSPHDFKYLCPLRFAVQYDLSNRNRDCGDLDCGKILSAQGYFDHLMGTPTDRQRLGYGERLERWLSLHHEEPNRTWHPDRMPPLERQTQLAAVPFISLTKLSGSLNAVRNNENETTRKTDFAGVTVPQVQTARSSYVSFASQARAGWMMNLFDLFVAYDLAHTRTSTGQSSGPPVINFADNRLALESGAFFHGWHFYRWHWNWNVGKKYPRFGPEVTVRYETQLFEPRDSFSLQDGTTLAFSRQRTRNLQYPRLGVRYENRKSSFRFGYEYANIERVKAYNFATGELTATCSVPDPSSPTAFKSCLIAGNTANPPTITALSRASAVLSKVNRSGLYFTGKLVFPSSSKVSFVSEHDFELFFSKNYGSNPDVASMTYWRYLLTNSVQFKIFDNFTASPKFEIFFFENQTAGNPLNQHFFRQFKSSIDLNYSFDWFRGNPWGAYRYKRPAQ